MLRRFLNHPASTNVTYYVALAICFYLLFTATLEALDGPMGIRPQAPRLESAPVWVSQVDAPAVDLTR